MPRRRGFGERSRGGKGRYEAPFRELSAHHYWVKIPIAASQARMVGHLHRGGPTSARQRRRRPDQDQAAAITQLRKSSRTPSHTQAIRAQSVSIFARSWVDRALRHD